MSTPPSQPADPWAQVINLAAGLAHEIKNPLSTINLNLQLLEEDWQEAGTPRERRALKRVQTLRGETSRLVALLEDFLRYARAANIEPRPCDLNHLVEDVLDFVAPQATRQGIQLHTVFAPGLPALQADPGLLKQALLNLAINAEEAMPQGGELIVRTSSAPPMLQVDLTDTGVGIPDHQLAKIFNVYFSTREGGSGLGLAITRRIIELHGGTIDVESEFGKGTHFTVRLPVAPQAAETPQ